MKLVEFQLRDRPPVQLIDVAGLTEVVALAGPNGVGKTSTLAALLGHFQQLRPDPRVRLKVVPTTPAERALWKDAQSLDTSKASEAETLRRFLQRSQKRGELRGGVLNFDSSRSFENIRSYQWSWDFQDPFEEAVDWNQSFQPVRDRFQDVIHSMLRKVRSHKEAISDRAIALSDAGETFMPLQLGDPLEKFKQAFARLLPGKTLLKLDQKTQAIQYMSGGVTLPLMSLSSGEREVVTIVFDFLLRDPHDCIVAFDEPELHLHPELSYRLLRTLRESGERNQFIFCTHSPDIITASLDQTVIFISPPSSPSVNQAITLREDDAAAQVLHLLGQSVGVISLGRRLVLIEGEKNSLDKQTYGAIVGADHPELVLVPTGGKGTMGLFVSALDDVLSKALWGIDWFMIADGDAAVGVGNPQDVALRSKGRARLLPRYHIENYFLDEEVISAVFEYLGEPDSSWLRDHRQIRDALRALAAPLVSYGAALRASHRLRLAAGNVDLMPRACHNLSLPALAEAFEATRAQEHFRLSAALSAVGVREVVEAEFTALEASLARDDESWKSLLPGRPILKAFVKKTPVDIGTFKRLYVRTAKSHGANPFSDIRAIFADFARFGLDEQSVQHPLQLAIE